MQEETDRRASPAPASLSLLLYSSSSYLYLASSVRPIMSICRPPPPRPVPLLVRALSASYTYYRSLSAAAACCGCFNRRRPSESRRTDGRTDPEPYFFTIPFSSHLLPSPLLSSLLLPSFFFCSQGRLQGGGKGAAAPP